MVGYDQNSIFFFFRFFKSFLFHRKPLYYMRGEPGFREPIETQLSFKRDDQYLQQGMGTLWGTDIVWTNMLDIERTTACNLGWMVWSRGWGPSRQKFLSDFRLFCPSFTSISPPPPETQVNYSEKTRVLGHPQPMLYIPAECLGKIWFTVLPNSQPNAIMCHELMEDVSRGGEGILHKAEQKKRVPMLITV